MPTAGEVWLNGREISRLAGEKLRRAAAPRAWAAAAGLADVSKLPDVAWPALETVDIALFGTIAGVAMTRPLAVLAAGNVTPSRTLYYVSRATIGFTHAVPHPMWALLFVTAVGLGPFPGGLALAVHSIGMLGRLFAETIKNMHMAPIDALALTEANRMQMFTHGVVPPYSPLCWGLDCTGWTRISDHPWCWTLSVPAA